MMSESDDQYENYIKDPRMPCKYGVKCYQKNPIHQEKYKHPPKKNEDKGSSKHTKKKFKLANKVIAKDVSESDEDSDTNPNGGKNNVAIPSVNNDVSDSEEEDPSRIGQNNSDTDCIEEHDTNYIKDKGSNSEIKEQPKDNKTGERDSNNYNTQHFFSNGSEEISEWSRFIEKKFLVRMPEDFYQFWFFCKKIKPSNGLTALKDVGLTLVGPFDVLAGRFENVLKSDEEFLIHWRYFRDPPELQTVLKGDDSSGYHIGYFRDDPKELPVFLASNSAKKDGVLKQMGGNIFAAANLYLEDLKKTGDPFKKMHIGKIQSALKNEAENLNIDMSLKTKNMIDREKQIVTRTFNKIGLVVPFDKKTELGYRELALNNKDLNTLLTKLQNSKTAEEKKKCLSALQSVFTYANIATDECDFGTGIELGWNLISHGVEDLNLSAEKSLTTNYCLLNREGFAKIAEAHMKMRRKGCDLSII